MCTHHAAEEANDEPHDNVHDVEGQQAPGRIRQLGGVVDNWNQNLRENHEERNHWRQQNLGTARSVEVLIQTYLCQPQRWQAELFTIS